MERAHPPLPAPGLARCRAAGQPTDQAGRQAGGQANRAAGWQLTKVLLAQLHLLLHALHLVRVKRLRQPLVRLSTGRGGSDTAGGLASTSVHTVGGGEAGRPAGQAPSC